MFPDTMIGVAIRQESINKYFLEHLWKTHFIRHQIEKSARTANGTYKINQGVINSIKLIFPPESLQDQFASIVEKVEGIKTCYQQSLADLKNLYGALSQKAFNGELDLSRIPLAAEDMEAMPPEIDEKHEKMPSFELPAPANLVTLSSAGSRKALLNQWMDVWLEHIGNAPFSSQHFMEAAQQRWGELVEDYASEWSTAEYDQLKGWVFDALESGRLAQTYDDAGNRVSVTATKG